LRPLLKHEVQGFISDHRDHRADSLPDFPFRLLMPFREASFFLFDCLVPHRRQRSLHRHSPCQGRMTAARDREKSVSSIRGHLESRRSTLTKRSTTNISAIPRLLNLIWLRSLTNLICNIDYQGLCRALRRVAVMSVNLLYAGSNGTAGIETSLVGSRTLFLFRLRSMRRYIQRLPDNNSAVEDTCSLHLSAYHTIRLAQ
jgi:hypothetical protein